MAEVTNNLTKKGSKKDYVFAVGRRREAVARIRLYPQVKDGSTWADLQLKKGEVLVNQKTFAAYFTLPSAQATLAEMLRTTNTENRFAITAKVVGGGLSGQLDAVIHGIARAMAAYDNEKLHGILRDKGYLTRDARVRQRRKAGMGGKSRRKRQSPKR